MTYQAAIFDLDGTLLNTLPDLHASVNATLSLYGFPERSEDEIRRAVGDGVGMLIARSIPEGANDPRYEDCLSAFREHYAKHAADRTAPYAGILSLLAALKAKGIRIGVVSNKFDAAVKALCRTYFGDLVELAVGEREGIRRKPCPDSLLAVSDNFSLTPKQCIYIGDSEQDILTARAAGLDCLSVTWGFRSRKALLTAGATQLIDSPADILSLLCK